MKKNIVIMFCLLLLINLSAEKNVTDSKFVNAVKLYNQEDFTDAVKQFLELEKDGYDNFQINFNIGNCYYKLKNIGLSRYYFEKALMINPYNRDITNNMKIVYNSIFKDKSMADQEVFIYKIIYFIPGFVLLITFTIFFLGGIISLCLFFIKNNKKNLFLLITIIFLTLSIFISIYFMIQYNEINKKTFIVTKPETSIFVTPSIKETVILKINEGVKGLYRDRVSDFIKVQLTDGTSGWVLTGDVVLKE